MFYVYHLIDSSTNQPFYVGKGVQHRCYEHIYDAKRPKHKQENSLKCNKIQSLINAGIDIITRKVGVFETEQQALEFEHNEIYHYGKIIDGTGCLTNILDGGTQPPKQPSKPVYSFNREGKLITTHSNTFIAANYLGVTVSVIQNCCAGRSKTCKGYALFYTSTPTSISIVNRFTNGNTKVQTVFQLNDTHQIINKYSSITEAAVATNTASRRISSAIIYQRRHRGWYWSL